MLTHEHACSRGTPQDLPSGDDSEGPFVDIDKRFLFGGHAIAQGSVVAESTCSSHRIRVRAWVFGCANDSASEDDIAHWGHGSVEY